jgi:hypothetical protein
MTIVQLIAANTTDTGLKVRCARRAIATGD